MEEEAEDSAEYATWRETTDLREPYRSAPSAACPSKTKLQKAGKDQEGPAGQAPEPALAGCRERTWRPHATRGARSPEAPLIVFINSKSGGHAGPRLTEVLQRALGQAQVASKPGYRVWIGAERLGLELRDQGAALLPAHTVCV